MKKVFNLRFRFKFSKNLYEQIIINQFHQIQLPEIAKFPKLFLNKINCILEYLSSSKSLIIKFFILQRNFYEFQLILKNLIRVSQNKLPMIPN